MLPHLTVKHVLNSVHSHNSCMAKWQFKKQEVLPLFSEYGRLINSRLVPELSQTIAHRVKANKNQWANTQMRMDKSSSFHIWVTGQVFDNKYFKYEVQHDPVPRYTGTSDTNWAILFWMNKIRGVYHQRDVVVSRVRREVSSLRLKAYKFEEDEQAISLIHRFSATSLSAVKSELDAHLFRLINAVHPMFCLIVDVFGLKLTRTERRKIIEGTIKPARA